MARVSQLIHLVCDPASSPVKGRFLNQLLPSIHIVHIASILEEQVTAYVDANFQWPPKMRPSLHNAIEVSCDKNARLNRTNLHKLRLDRNNFGHEANFDQAIILSWSTIDAHVTTFLDTLCVINSISFKPSITAKYERNSQFFVKEKREDNIVTEHNHIITVQIDGADFLKFTQSVGYEGVS